MFPYLLPKWHASMGPHPLEGLSLPALSLFLSRAKTETHAHLDYEHALMPYFNMPPLEEVPVGALTALAYEKTGGQWWLRADPVVFQPQNRSVILIGNAALELHHTEVNALVVELNMVFQAYDMTLEVLTPTEWVLYLPHHPAISTQPLFEAVGQNISDFLPREEAYQLWQKILTEVQMTLYASPTNQERVQKGKESINGLWLWGGGELPSAVTPTLSGVWTDESLATGLAKLNNVTLHALPSSILSCLPYFQAGGHYLMIATQLRKLFVHGRIDEWKAAIQALEALWFMPLLTYLRTGALREVRVDTCDGRVFVSNLKSIRQWWKRSKEVAHFAASDPTST